MYLIALAIQTWRRSKPARQGHAKRFAIAPNLSPLTKVAFHSHARCRDLQDPYRKNLSRPDFAAGPRGDHAWANSPIGSIFEAFEDQSSVNSARFTSKLAAGTQQGMHPRARHSIEE